MGPPIPTPAELLRFAEEAKAQRKATAEKLLTDRAIADHTEAIALDPNYAVAYSNRGGAYYRKGEVDRGIADYTKAIALDPNNATAYSNRGTAYCLKREVDRAIADFRKALEIDPSYQQAKDNLKDLGVTP